MEARGKPVRESLILETVKAPSDPLVQFHSFVGFVNQIPGISKIELGSSLGAAPPTSMPSLLWQGFLNPSLKPSSSNVTHDLLKPQNCLVEDGQFGGLWCGIRVASYGVVGMVEKEIMSL
jgi:hypothetical protein